MICKRILAMLGLTLGLSGAWLHAQDQDPGFLLVNKTQFPLVLHIGPEPAGHPTYSFIPTDTEGTLADEQQAFHNHNPGKSGRELPLDVNRALKYTGDGIGLEKIQLSFTITGSSSEGSRGFAFDGRLESSSIWEGMKYKLFLDKEIRQGTLQRKP